MAKRKRLTPPNPDNLAPSEPTVQRAPSLGAVNPPIAEVARDAAREAAMTEVAEELASARQEGRLVQMLPLEAIEIDYLVRDRIRAEDDEMAALKASIAARGQQTPIDVIMIEPGRYGLISGWRRLAALKALKAETGEARFDQVKALNRTPESSSEAYIAMVEENEIRVGLSYYERARIALKAAEQGAYPTPRKAVLELFRSASRAKRSKIGSFLTLVEALDDTLRFPEAIPERLGLRLAKHLEDLPGMAERLQGTLAFEAPAIAEDEVAALERHLKRTGESAPSTSRSMPEPRSHRAGAGLSVQSTDKKIVITGALASHGLAAAIAEWLKDRHG